ncbi:MAG: hypothetical protein HY010_04755 [Acidobacteria bacterium]|nr:hypothetical protein [Acidobacteriota bacterium]
MNIRNLALTAVFALCSLAALAVNHDPKIIIHGTGSGGAPTQCPPAGCLPVGTHFTFSVNHNGGTPLQFNNASGQDWTALTLTETGVAAEDVTCKQTVFLICTVTALDNGATQIVLSGVRGLNLRNGIPAGSNFSIGFGCVQRICWPRGLHFDAQASTAFATIDYPGATATFVYGINNAGDMVGAYIDDGEGTHGFLLSHGLFTTIDFPDSSLSVASGINNHGDIAGQYNDWEGHGHGFVLSGGEFTTVDIGPGYQTFPTAIDDFGDLVGFCTDSEFNFHGCIAFDGPLTLFDYPGASASLALGVSFNGLSIVGGYGTDGGSTFDHGYLYQDGEFSQIDFPGNPTVAFGVNVPGEIVGNYWIPPSNTPNGFSLISGTYTTTNIPGALQTNPINLNDSGQVVGWYVDSSNRTHGYTTSN